MRVCVKINETNLTFSSGVSSITELHEAGVILEGFAFNPDDIEQNIIEMPLNMKSMQDHALGDAVGEAESH